MQAPTPESDEIKGMALLVLAGALGLVALIAASAGGGGLPIAARREAPSRGSVVAELPRPPGPLAPAPLERGAMPTPALGSGAYATGIAREDDPQMLAFERSFGRPEDAGIGQPFAIAYYRGTLVSASGVSVRPGARCEVRVLPVRSYEFNCLVRVTCDDVVLYPDEALRAGYAPCEIDGREAVTAVDTSSHDGDREIDLDVRARSVLVEEHEIYGEPPLVSARVLLES